MNWNRQKLKENWQYGKSKKTYRIKGIFVASNNLSRLTRFRFLIDGPGDNKLECLSVGGFSYSIIKKVTLQILDFNWTN